VLAIRVSTATGKAQDDGDSVLITAAKDLVEDLRLCATQRAVAQIRHQEMMYRHGRVHPRMRVRGEQPWSDIVGQVFPGIRLRRDTH
jgi:hypothetical protein